MTYVGQGAGSWERQEVVSHTGYRWRAARQLLIISYHIRNSRTWTGLTRWTLVFDHPSLSTCVDKTRRRKDAEGQANFVHSWCWP